MISIRRVETMVCEEWQHEWGPGGAGGSGLLAVEPLPAGAASQPFPPGALLAALELPAPPPCPLRLCAATLRECGARVAAAARLARDHTAAGAVLRAHAATLHVQLLRPLQPHDELLLWPDPALATLIHLPCLMPHNITAGPSYVCGACGARFLWPHELKAHAVLACRAPRRAPLLRLVARALQPPPRPAPGAPLHRCTVCGKQYSRRYGLKIHLRTHSGHKPLRCPHCARAFADPSNLNKHRRLHQRPPHHHHHHQQPLPLPHTPRRNNTTALIS